MKILLAGSHGMIGRAVSQRLESAGTEIIPWRVPRPDKERAGEEASWQFIGQNIDSKIFQSGYDAFMFFAGSSINQRWTDTVKHEVEYSRTYPCSWMAEHAAKSTTRPRVIISASAVGYYGDRGEEVLTEESPPGLGFLPETVERWEAAWQPAVNAGIPVIKLRLGIVLSRNGGALKSMTPPFKMGLGGPIAGGNQWMSWIHLDDVAGLVEYALRKECLKSGPVNVVAPDAVRNKEFMHALGKSLNRPAIIPIPGLAIKTLFGEMGTTAMLSSARVLPTKLKAAGFSFKYPEIQKCLETCVSK